MHLVGVRRRVPRPVDIRIGEVVNTKAPGGYLLVVECVAGVLGPVVGRRENHSTAERVLAGRGEGSRVLQVGLSEASVLFQKIQSFSDPRLYALQLVAEQLAQSKQPLVPERVFMAGGAGVGAEGGQSAASAGQGLLGMLISLMVAERSGFELTENSSSSALKEFNERMTRQAMDSMAKSVESDAAEVILPKGPVGTNGPALQETIRMS